MKIMVNGEERNLVAVGKNSVEWTEDLLGSYDGLHYDDDADAYVMSEDEYSWWEPVVEDLNKVQELEDELLEEMDESSLPEYERILEDYNELDDIARAKRDFLESYKEGKA